MRNSFVLIFGDGENGSVLWVASGLLSFDLNFQADSGGTDYVLLQYMMCTPVLDEMIEDLGYVCLRWYTTDEKDHSTVAREELDNRTDLDVGP